MDEDYAPSEVPVYQDNTQDNSPALLQNQSNETIRWLEETNDIIKELELTLLNKYEVLDQKTGIVSLRSGKGNPYMNEEGVNRIVALIRPHFHRGITLSNFTDKDVNRIMQILHIKIAMLLGRNYDLFGIEKGNLKTVIEIITNIIYATFKRAVSEGERVMFGRTQKGLETRVVGVNEQRKKILGIF